jgi:hypothetical protein
VPVKATNDELLFIIYCIINNATNMICLLQSNRWKLQQTANIPNIYDMKIGYMGKLAFAAFVVQQLCKTKECEVKRVLLLKSHIESSGWMIVHIRYLWIKIYKCKITIETVGFGKLLAGKLLNHEVSSTKKGCVLVLVVSQKLLNRKLKQQQKILDSTVVFEIIVGVLCAYFWFCA